jgi:hypothetical protein
MFRRMLQSLGLARRPSYARRYGAWGGGATLPILALFGWRNRDRIRQFLRGRFGHRNAAMTTSPPHGFNAG